MSKCMRPNVSIFFNDTAPTEIYPLSLHDALPIYTLQGTTECANSCQHSAVSRSPPGWASRSEEHTSELQSQFHLVCRLLFDKKALGHLTVYLHVFRRLFCAFALCWLHV